MTRPAPLFLFAVPHEAAGLAKATSARWQKRGTGLYETSATYRGQPVRAACLGMGPIAGANAAITIAAAKPASVLMCGYAGALDPSLRLGDLVAGGDAAPQGFRIARCATLAAVASTPAEKETLRVRTGADICDMEYASVKKACDDASIPCGFLRAISDTAADRLPADALAASYDMASQSPSIAPLLAHWLAHPSDIPPFIRFVSGLAVARRALTTAILSILDPSP